MTLKYIFAAVGIVLLSSCSGSDTTDEPSTTPETNNIPIAKAGSDLSIDLTESTILNGFASSDEDSDPLTYIWTIIAKPNDSVFEITNQTQQEFTFTPDVAGEFTFSLVVNDGEADSTSDEVTITVNELNVPTPINEVPVADAGNDQSIVLGVTAELDGSQSSDPEGSAITYSWQLESKPTTSALSLSGTSSVELSFTPDVIGEYQLSLEVSDGELISAADTVTITVTEVEVVVNADFYTPEAINMALTRSRDVTWTTLANGVEDLTRFVLTADLSVAVTETNGEVDTDLHLSQDVTSSASNTDDTLLRHMLQAVEIETGLFRIMSVKHSNFAIDYDADHGHFVWQDIRGAGANVAGDGFVLFTFTIGNSYTISASKRYAYNSTNSEYSEDNTWTSSSLAVSGDSLVLSSTATNFSLHEAPIDFTIPFDFNPDFAGRADNPEVTPESKDDAVSQTADKVSDDYAAQLSAAGSNDDTLTAATSMLTQIETDLESAGSALRYPKSFYLAFREGLFARSIKSLDATDSTLDQLTVPYVYFTNESDDNGVLHPFMVIASFGMPDSLALLWDVPTPPGDGASQEYDDQSVTRSYHKEAFLMKIPLKDYGIVESLTENNMENDLASDVGETAFDHHNYASISATGVAVDGVIIYPSYNNALHVAQSAAELSAHGMHAGRGLGVHYHADAHSATEEGLNLYNWHDYDSHSHPPIISMGFDGVAGYGIYKSDDTTSDGVSISLDDFGGHTHGDYGYHYHSQQQADVTEEGKGPGDPEGGTSYTKHLLPPYGAWAGKINDIPDFWDGTAPNYVGGNSKYLGTD